MKLSALLFVALTGFSAFAAALPAPGVTSTEILIGHDVDLTGTISPRMKPLIKAADAYIDQVNKTGGVNGRKIKILRRDSVNKPEITKTNVTNLVEKDGVFAMWGISGTGSVKEALTYLSEKNVPLIGSTSGAETFYSKTHPMMINVKASYADEIRTIAQHFRILGLSKVGIIYVDNGFGREALVSAKQAVEVEKFNLVGITSFKEDASDVTQAVKPIAAKNPQAVFLLTLSGPAPKLVQAYRDTEHLTQLAALSIAAPEVLFSAIGSSAHGVAVTQVVPFPWDASLHIVKEYQDLMKSVGVQDYSMGGMEGFILAKMLVEGLKSAGKNPTRESLMAGFHNMKGKNLGGMIFNYSPTNHNGSKLVEITMIGKTGKLVR